ncbi:TetR/AcrR family transcriptional regulator [Siphonobacter sp. SORGH_AS_0500]|uniref:TetR/AcrR family transcriptional regulator n=1 Tax=Siphonobacter sp. SORGH_AS_0500 TaxID=1864824 RepID=UPI002865B7C2|nr:TetR/AcrR family transcriptional regulator [Siphonobacter sp. SORGH_AS_0500]MDR6197210.1 TetR/AcrR family transcriptional repressor of nem operon [Siphonobacter sp. SORGH_AS_0500]
MFVFPQAEHDMSKAAQTRQNILYKAFEMIYQKGFQATSIDEIIATTQVTKGAFFYHFKNKEDMGLAMIREFLAPGMQAAIITPLSDSKNPLDSIYDMMHYLLLKDPFFNSAYGCPAVNLIDEMSPVNALFKEALLEISKECQRAIQVTLQRGIENGHLRKDVDAKHVSIFIIMSYSGVRNMGKLLGPACYPVYLKELKAYLANLT